MARQLVQQLALTPGERVISLAQPGVFADLVPYLRYEVMRAGGIDLGVVEVLREPVPESFDPPVLINRSTRRPRVHTRPCSGTWTPRSCCREPRPPTRRTRRCRIG